MESSRRNIALWLTGGAVAMLAAGCTQQQVNQTETALANIINQVQMGVRKACTTAGVLVPQANSVLAVLRMIVQGGSVVLSTAAMIATAIADIVAVACPPAPTTLGAEPKTASGIVVHFY